MLRTYAEFVITFFSHKELIAWNMLSGIRAVISVVFRPRVIRIPPVAQYSVYAMARQLAYTDFNRPSLGISTKLVLPYY